jgi:non-ribosomal peptide synthase protein (TIGR01720 family)
LDLGQAADPGKALQAIKEQLRGIPSRGIGYGVLRYLYTDTEVTEQLRRLPQAEVSFNYLGQLHQDLPEALPFRPAREAIGPERSPRGSRKYLLEINGQVARGQLQLVWTYSENVHRHSTIEQLAQGYAEELRTLIRHCQSPEAGGFTPSDFPLLHLNQRHIDQIIGKVEVYKERT